MSTKFQIKFLTTQKITGCLPKGDTLAHHAAVSFGHILNTDKHRNKTYGARQFADLIESVYDRNNPQTAAVCAHLRSLEPQPQTAQTV
jgi:hypothetical protein